MYPRDHDFPFDLDEVSFAQVQEFARQQWQGAPLETSFVGRWYYLSDIEFGPDIQFRAPELLGPDSLVCVSDQLKEGQPQAYFLRYIARLGPSRTKERWIDAIVGWDGSLQSVTACPYPYFPDQDDRPLQPDELMRLCWAAHLIVLRLAGRPVRQRLQLGKDPVQPV